MKKYEKIYKELRKQYTDEEIADCMLIPQDLEEQELEKANEELRAFRFKLIRERINYIPVMKALNEETRISN